MNDDKKNLYVLDEKGSPSPESLRIHEVYGINHALLRHSTAIGEAAVGLRHLTFDLASSKDESPARCDGGYRFPAEESSKEELLRIADYLTKLNMRIWSISRTLGTQANALAERINSQEDGKFGEELDEFLKTETVA